MIPMRQKAKHDFLTYALLTRYVEAYRGIYIQQVADFINDPKNQKRNVNLKPYHDLLKEAVNPKIEEKASDLKYDPLKKTFTMTIHITSKVRIPGKISRYKLNQFYNDDVRAAIIMRRLAGIKEDE